jgi:nicotinamidase-related amidase
VKNVFVVGLAYDFCAGLTAIDSAKNGYTTFVIKDACKGIFESGINEMEEYFKVHEIKVISSEELKEVLV